MLFLTRRSLTSCRSLSAWTSLSMHFSANVVKAKSVVMILTMQHIINSFDAVWCIHPVQENGSYAHIRLLKEIPTSALWSPKYNRKNRKDIGHPRKDSKRVKSIVLNISCYPSFHVIPCHSSPPSASQISLAFLCLGTRHFTSKVGAFVFGEIGKHTGTLFDSVFVAVINLRKLFFNVFAVFTLKIDTSEYECMISEIRSLKIHRIPESQQRFTGTQIYSKPVSTGINEMWHRAFGSGTWMAHAWRSCHNLQNNTSTLPILCQLLGCWLNIFIRPMHMCTTPYCKYSRSFNNILVLRCS